MLAKVKIEPIRDENGLHKLFVDGKDISNIVSGVNINVNAGSFPECVITLDVRRIEFNGQANVKYNFAPGIVQQAVVVMRNELLKHGEFYDGFRASVMSAVDECRTEAVTRDEMVDAIMKRIIGED